MPHRVPPCAVCLLAACLLGLGCGDASPSVSPEAAPSQTPAPSNAPETSSAAPLAQPAAPTSQPGVPAGATAPDALPADFDSLILQARRAADVRHPELVHRAMNRHLMGEAPPGGPWYATGAEVAARWHALIDASAQTLLYRSSFFDQQDDPLRQASPVALMPPPSWLVHAVQRAHDRRPPQGLTVPELGDDDAWRGLMEDELFGSYPPLTSLWELATGRLDESLTDRRQLILRARASVIALQGMHEALIAVHQDGAEATADLAAQLVASSDAAYFGAERRGRVIPISVVWPSVEEAQEGVGFFAPGDDEAVRALATRRILRARLAAGPIGLARVTLSSPEARAESIELLADLIPAARRRGRHPIWLLLTHHELGNRNTSPEAALRQLGVFKLELSEAGVDMERLRLVSPGLVLSPDEGPALLEAATAYRQAGLQLPLNFDGAELEQALSSSGHRAVDD